MNLMAYWSRLSAVPGGRRLFSLFLNRWVPYTGSIGAEVLEMGEGSVAVRLRDRRAVRNHLNSIHAVALMNLAELSSGLAVNSALPSDCRGIVTRFSIEFLKKARGTLHSRCSCTLPEITEPTEFPVTVEVTDGQGDVVCRAEACWLLDRKKARKG